jgi:hypothetical protein
MMRGIAAATCVAAMLASTGAQADSSFAWGVHGNAQSGGNFVTPGLSFNDTYSFSIANALVIVSSVTVANNNPPEFSIFGGRYSLYGVGGDNAVGTSDDVNLGPTAGWTFDGTTGETPHLVSLAAGDYYFAVRGFADGAFGGLYSITSSSAYTELASPVPEPPVYGLLLAGFALLQLRKRSRR